MIWYTRKESTLPRGEDESALFRRRVDDLWQQISMQRAWTTRPLLTNASLICIVPSFVSVRLAEISKLDTMAAIAARTVIWARFWPPHWRVPTPKGIKCCSILYKCINNHLRSNSGEPTWRFSPLRHPHPRRSANVREGKSRGWGKRRDPGACSRPGLRPRYREGEHSPSCQRSHQPSKLSWSQRPAQEGKEQGHIRATLWSTSSAGALQHHRQAHHTNLP